MKVHEIFDQAIGPIPPSGVDVDQIFRRQRRSGRLRSGAAVLAGVMVLATAVGVGNQVIGGGEGASQPLVIQDSLAGFPEYLAGFRVVEAAEVPMTEPLTLTFTPAASDLALYLRCEGHGLDPGYELTIEVEVNDPTVDHTLLCAETVSPADADEQTLFWYLEGIRVGEPVTITATPTGARHAFDGAAPRLPVPEVGTLALAVAEPVPFEEYPLPEQPAQQQPLPEPEGTTVVRAELADPGQPVETTMVWDAHLAGCDLGSGDIVHALNLVSQTPGTLRVLVDGVPVITETWWDYEQTISISDLGAVCDQVTDGEEVTVRVEPEHVTGDWWVTVGGAGG